MLLAKYVLKITVMLSLSTIVDLGAVDFFQMLEFAFLFEKYESIGRIWCILCYTE